MPRPGRMTTERAKDFKGTLLQLVRNLGAFGRHASGSWHITHPPFRYSEI